MRQPRRQAGGPDGQGGWSLFETVVSIGVIAAGLLVLVQQMSISFRESEQNEYRAFAHYKAAALLGELHNAIAMGRITNSDELFALVDDGPNVVLTTRVDREGLPFAPAHPMSGNTRRRDHWLWSRRISVTPGENSGLYYCRVQVDRWGEDGSWHYEASTAQLFSLLPSTDAPEQLFDVYVLACAGAPSMLGDLAELRQHVESAADSIMGQSQARLRLHWIDRLGYGRDPCYAPYVNTVRPADAAAPHAYWLPGALGPPHTGAMLYRSELLRGLHRNELGLLQAESSQVPVPVTLADRNNHCMRTPAAWSLFEERVAAGLEDPAAPPLQLLLDDMQRRPQRYRNALFLNLHGSALPFPPLRNYSDAAKAPLRLPGVRAVTHPARLWTPRDPDGDGDHLDTEEVELRVYGYRTEPGAAVLDEPITVQIYGADLTGAVNAAGDAATLRVHRLQGGVDEHTGAASGAREYVGFDEPGGAAPQRATAPREMWFEVGYTGGAEPHTWLRLHNTPLVAPPVGTRGLPAAARLYGLDYVPAAVDGTFAQDLAFDSAAAVPRNTARWRIRIPRTALQPHLLGTGDRMVRVVTRIGADTRTGRRWPAPHEPLNRSETYAWWTHSPEAVPWTERSQLLGDPRHNPYRDLTRTGVFADGYNWHFDDLTTPAADARGLWPGLDPARLQDGFGAGADADAPRALQLLRESLQACVGVLISPGPGVADTLLLGGEIALATPTGLEPVSLHPDFGAGALAAVDTIRPGSQSGTLVLQRGAAADWWARPWLGELFPDDLAGTWYGTGNLPLADATPSLRWVCRQGSALPDLPAGTAFDAPAGAALGSAGGAVLLNHGGPAGAFGVRELAAVELATPTPAQLDVNEAANVVAPPRLTVTDCYGLAVSLADPPAAFGFTDSYPRSLAAQLEPLWLAPSGPVGGVVAFGRRADAPAFLVPMTLQPSERQHRELCVQALLGGLRAIHTAGATPSVGRIPQVPLLEIIAPAAGDGLLDPTTITVRWQTSWTRFDGAPYTSAYASGFAEDESELVYRVLWSGDDGETWVSAVTDMPAAAGQYPETAAEYLVDTGTGPEAFTFPASELPAGNYEILVEAWRRDRRCHSAAHRVRAFLRRPR